MSDDFDGVPRMDAAKPSVAGCTCGVPGTVAHNWWCPVLKAKPQWTREPPTKPGWYWAREPGQTPRMVQLERRDDPAFGIGERLVAYSTRTESSDELRDFDLWCGPIEAPPLPEGA